MKWIHTESDACLARELEEALALLPSIASILVKMGYESVEEAEKEFRDERFGYHEFWYGNLLELLRKTDWAAMRERLKAR